MRLYLFPLLMLLLYTGANLYLYLRTRALLVGLPVWGQWLFALLFWVAAFSLFVAVAAERASWPMPLCATLFRVGSVWMPLLLYMTLLLLVADLGRLAGLSPRVGYLTALSLTSLLLLVGNIRYRHPKVERVTLRLDKRLERPLKVAFVSDVHLGYGTGRKALARYVDMIRCEAPDLVLIGGDLIDNSVRPVVHHEMACELERLTAPLGVWMVPGNHEYISGMEACRGWLATTPIRLLQDEVVMLDGGLQLLGRDDRSQRGRLPLDSLLKRVDATRPLLLIDHQPAAIGEADRPEVDLQLYGHTHRGQLWPLSWFTDRLYEQSHGLRAWRHSQVCVSSGLSLWGPPFRIGTQSEMYVFTLE